MRHLGSFVLCIIVGAGVYVLAGITGSKWLEAQTTTGGRHWGALALALVAALAAGGLYGFLVLARLSPVGTVVAGLAFLSVALWGLFSPSSLLDVLPRNLFGIEDAGVNAAGPFSLVLSVPLLLTVFSPRRWRRWGNAPAAVAPAPSYAPPPPSPYGSPAGPSYGSPAAPSYGAPASAAPSYAPVSPPYGSPEPASPAGTYAPPGTYGSSTSFPPPYTSGDDPESTRRL